MNNVITASLNHSNESIARALAFSAARGDDGIIYCSSIGDHRPRRKVVSARSTTPTVFESLDIARQFQSTSKATSKSFKSNPTPIKFRLGRSVLTDRPSICALHSPIEILPVGLTITRNLLNTAIV